MLSGGTTYDPRWMGAAVKFLTSPVSTGTFLAPIGGVGSNASRYPILTPQVASVSPRFGGVSFLYIFITVYTGNRV